MVLPELWASGADGERLSEITAQAAEAVPGPRSAALAEAARKHAIWLVAGSVPEQVDDLIYNTTLVFDPSGAISTAHRKAHLYSPTGEDKIFARGDDVSVVETDHLGTIGVATSFDGDHPGYARAMRDRGARLVVMPAAYEVAAESWWNILHPANALANGQWWIIANQCGGEGEAALFGRSRIIAPDGTVVTEAPRHTDSSGPHLIVSDIDLQAGIEAADDESAPLWIDARPEIYPV